MGSTQEAEVLWIARYDYRPSWELERHAHEYFQLFCFLSGRGVFLLDGEKTRITKDLVVLVKPGQQHGLFAEGAVRTLDVKFKVRIRPHGLGRALLKGPNLFVDTGTSTGELLGIGDLLESIRREGEKQSPLFRELCDAQLLTILVRLVRDGAEPKGTRQPYQVPRAVPLSPLVESVKSYLEAHHRDGVREDLLARELGFSVRHIRNEFARELGASPMRYLLQFRVTLAQELIGRSDYELKQVAEIVGFKSVHHFTRVFGRVVGIPPGVFRGEVQRGIRKAGHLASVLDKIASPGYPRLGLSKTQQVPAHGVGSDGSHVRTDRRERGAGG
jgi:AraC-like DNA-binding protein